MDIFNRILSIGLALVFLFVVAKYPDKIIDVLEWFIALCMNIADQIGQADTPSAEDIRPPAG